MSGPLTQIAANLTLAWLAGAAVGFERSYNGRAAGFRTHSLVALAAASVMIISYVAVLSPGYPAGTMRLDPTRLAQGVMTGIGFLGAGVIFKEGVSVQGLTTAACIWATAGIGMLFGLGLWAPGGMTLLGVLITLTAMRWVEGRFPWRVYALAVFRFHAPLAPSETELEALLGGHDVSLGELSYRLVQDGEVFEYQASVETRRDGAFRELAERLRTLPGLIGYELSRISK
jgi:putative Mg2+ transporter-C (MgtC) family protein